MNVHACRVLRALRQPAAAACVVGSQAGMRLSVQSAGRVSPGGSCRPARAVTPLALQGHSAAVTGLAFSENGDRLVTCSMDCTARVWDTCTGAVPELVR